MQRHAVAGTSRSVAAKLQAVSSALWSVRKEIRGCNCATQAELWCKSGGGNAGKVYRVDSRTSKEGRCSALLFLAETMASRLCSMGEGFVLATSHLPHLCPLWVLCGSCTEMRRRVSFRDVLNPRLLQRNSFMHNLVSFWQRPICFAGFDGKTLNATPHPPQQQRWQRIVHLWASSWGVAPAKIVEGESGFSDGADAGMFEEEPCPVASMWKPHSPLGGSPGLVAPSR
eukprot:s2229_g2.t1